MRTTTSKLFSLLRDKRLTVQHVEIEDKDTDEISTVSTEQFFDDLEFFCASGIFANSTDVKYELKGALGLEARIGYQNPYSNVCIKAELQIPGGTDTATLKSQLKIE